MILVVDDHEDTRLALQKILELEGYQVYGVSSGGEALGFLGRFTPQLVILDYNMPDMDGFAVAAEIRKNIRLTETRIILFTAHDRMATREHAQLLGIDAYIVKASLDWMKLHDEIVRLAGRGPSPTRLPAAPPAQDAGTG